jgi:hypothetical protein
VRRGTESAQASRDEIVQMITGARPMPVETPRVAPTAPPPPVKTESRAPAPVEKRKPSAARQPAKAPVAATVKAEAARAATPNGAIHAKATAAPQAEPLLELYEEPAQPDPIAPTTGVEILEAFEQDGVRYYTLRDLRYHKLIFNVTKTTDRRLWRSAIAQREKGELDESAVRWEGDFGLWRSYRQRAGERRYDLVYRGDGDPRVFYGVSEAGMAGRWKPLQVAAKAPA